MVALPRILILFLTLRSILKKIKKNYQWPLLFLSLTLCFWIGEEKKENLHKGLAACLIEARCHVWGVRAKAEMWAVLNADSWMVVLSVASPEDTWQLLWSLWCSAPWTGADGRQSTSNRVIQGWPFAPVFFFYRRYSRIFLFWIVSTLMTVWGQSFARS